MTTKTTVYCCVVGCNNTKFNSPGTEFYCFPTSNPLHPHKVLRREKWLTAVRREDEDGSPWLPNKKTRICSRHFVGNKKSEDPRSPSFSPTIFPEVYRRVTVPEKLSIGRYKRRMERRNKRDNEDETSSTSKKLKTDNHPEDLVNDNLPEENESAGLNSLGKVDQSVQVDLPFPSSFGIQQVFICNRYVKDNVCDVETQACSPNVKYLQIKAPICKTRDVCCGTNVNFEDKKVGPDQQDNDHPSAYGLAFRGVESIKTDQEMLDIAGITLTTFQLLLKILSKQKVPHGIKLSLKNRCLIFLSKMKTGLSFSALSIF